MDVNFSLLENWKVLLGLALVVAISVAITIKFVRNKVRINKKISAKDGSVAVDGGVHAPININSSKKN